MLAKQKAKFREETTNATLSVLAAAGINLYAIGSFGVFSPAIPAVLITLGLAIAITAGLLKFSIVAGSFIYKMIAESKAKSQHEEKMLSEENIKKLAIAYAHDSVTYNAFKTELLTKLNPVEEKIPDEKQISGYYFACIDLNKSLAIAKKSEESKNAEEEFSEPDMAVENGTEKNRSFDLNKIFDAFLNYPDFFKQRMVKNALQKRAVPQIESEIYQQMDSDQTSHPKKTTNSFCNIYLKKNIRPY